MRDLGPNDVDKLIALRGIVIRTSDIVPEMRDAFFRCTVCGQEETATLERAMIQEPSVCRNCHTRSSFELIHNRSSFSDKQHVKLQETPESIPEGETPQTVHLCCYDELVDFVKPGDRVELTGIYRVQSVRVNPLRRVLKSVHKTYIDVLSFYIPDKKKILFGDQLLDKEDEESKKFELTLPTEDAVMFSESLKESIIQFSREPDVYDKLVDAIAPSIWENADIKKGLLLQLFGGISKNFSQSGRGRFRGEVNILLVGDPSTAKSQFLQYVHKLSQRGIYTSGKGSSAVGLTAYVSKDPETKEIILESGALVLSDQGICCIDEFDKMNDNTRVILHEAMEQQTISIAKAGIICQLNARTAILAAANPCDSKYNVKLSVIDNIKLPPTLLSRFDLIYLILDCQNRDMDEKLAYHIVALYGDKPPASSASLSREFLVAYLTYARKMVHPQLTQDVEDVLIQEYVDMRSSGASKTNITATPRQLESLIRLSEAHARMRLSSTVEREDVEEAVRLVKAAMKKAYVDPMTGQIDITMIYTGISELSKENIEKLTKKIRRVLVRSLVTVEIAWRNCAEGNQDAGAAGGTTERDQFQKSTYSC
eukprot:TRINITY_DN1092_c0_g1_i1.p1 TRINITY_DN1092_c0_g1~~TRINITY_DN1092_c0_g1_i1.p1  ORF type:complete len:596 (+),score=169.48 TRINITY_DN1092_c0_g1_i1:701-2488(+)